MGAFLLNDLVSGIIKLWEKFPINLSSILNLLSLEIKTFILISTGKSLILYCSRQIMIESARPL